MANYIGAATATKTVRSDTALEMLHGAAAHMDVSTLTSPLSRCSRFGVVGQG